MENMGKKNVILIRYNSVTVLGMWRSEEGLHYTGMQLKNYFVSLGRKKRQIWANERYGGVNSAKIWDWGVGGRVVEQLNCWAWVSNLAWTPGSAYCLVEAAGEIFGLESKNRALIWLSSPACSYLAGKSFFSWWKLRGLLEPHKPQ